MTILSSHFSNHWRTGRRILLIFLVSLVSGCTFQQDLPPCDIPENCSRIRVAPGPEDFVFDPWHASPRLLVSCSERRTKVQTGDIYAFDLATQKIKKMPRKGENGSFENFAPHGVDIRRTRGETILYAVIHDPFGNGRRDENAIARYRVFENHLEFMPPLLKDAAHLWSPNDLSVMDNGEIYVTNDFQHLFHAAFRMKTSDIVHFNPQTGRWKKVGPDIALANGILARKDHVYVCASKEDRLYRFDRKMDGGLENPAVITEIRGPDNIMVYRDKLLIPAHFDDIAFFFHIRSEENISPTVVYLVDPATKSKTVLYADSGKNFSAASSAFIFNNRLYLSQVFNAYLLICDLDETVDH